MTEYWVLCLDAFRTQVDANCRVKETRERRAVMHEEEVLGLIRRHVQNEKLMFSVCTGALLCCAACVTAGLDAALVLVSLLRGEAAAQEIQLAIEYAPNPIFHSGTPESAPAEVLESFQRKYEPIGAAREVEAIRYAAASRC
jgi:cyclohexyl-isocyanide hydratase